MNKRYGVVLIGCGHIGQEHIEDIYFRDNIRVVATVDTREEQARLFARPVRGRPLRDGLPPLSAAA